MKPRKPSKTSWKVMVSLTSTFLFFLLMIACGNTAKPKADTTPATVDTLKEAPVMPEYPGGVKALIDYLRIQYPVPKGTNSNGETGRAIIRFVIDEQGRAIQPTVLRSVDKILDRRAIDKIRRMPRWKPGELEVIWPIKNMPISRFLTALRRTLNWLRRSRICRKIMSFRRRTYCRLSMLLNGGKT